MEQYRSKIKDILKKSDLSSITTKSVRRVLEREEGISLTPIKKELNGLIEELFIAFQDAQEASQNQSPVVHYAQPTIKAEPVVTQTKAQREAMVVRQSVQKNTIKKEPGSKVMKKKVVKKATAEPEEKKKRVVNQKVFKITPPLSYIIGTELCSRFRSVKKIWEYIRKHDLQIPTDKRKINCDANLKALTGLDQVTAFSINKFTQKCFVPIPEEEQEHYKQIFKEQEDALAPDDA